VIGNQKEEPLRRFTTKISGGRYRPAEGRDGLRVYVETDPMTASPSVSSPSASAAGFGNRAGGRARDR